MRVSAAPAATGPRGTGAILRRDGTLNAELRLRREGSRRWADMHNPTGELGLGQLDLVCSGFSQLQMQELTHCLL